MLNKLIIQAELADHPRVGAPLRIDITQCSSGQLFHKPKVA